MIRPSCPHRVNAAVPFTDRHGRDMHVRGVVRVREDGTVNVERVRATIHGLDVSLSDLALSDADQARALSALVEEARETGRVA